MLRFLVDENFNYDIVRGLLRRAPTIDLRRVQDEGLSGADDPTILAWAAETGRILLTHDVSTITDFAYQRVRAGLTMPGVIEVNQRARLGQIIEDILLLAEVSATDEWEGQILYVPLR